MLSRNHKPAGTSQSRTGLDAAIITSVLAIGTLNLLVLADQIGVTKAYAAAPCRCGAIHGAALA